MLERFRNLDPLIHIVLFVGMVILGGTSFFLFNEVQRLKSFPAEGNLPIANIIKDECGENCKEEIKKIVGQPSISEATSTPKATSTTVIKTTPKEDKVTYLNLNGIFTTQATDWTDVTSTDVWINLKEEYGSDAYVDWEAFLKTTSSGSKVYGRLYDVTNKIGVIGSEFESNSITTVRLSSGRLYLWQGHNLYRVQIKSLNGADGTFEGGRIKIVY